MDDLTPKPKTVTFTLDDEQVTTESGNTIWQAAIACGTDIPHLCYKMATATEQMVIAGPVWWKLRASACWPLHVSGRSVRAWWCPHLQRAQTAQKMVMELLVADQPIRATAPDPQSQLWTYAEMQNVTDSRFARTTAPPNPDSSHPAIAVNMEACIQCNLCVRACREVQVNDVIGLAGRGADAHIIFDFDDEMGASTCVGCGECVQACPTGALMPKAVLDEKQNSHHA